MPKLTVVDRLRVVIRAAFIGSREHGSFLRGSGTEISPNAFLVLDQVEAALANRIICAAIRWPDGTVVRGHRHGDALRTSAGIQRLREFVDRRKGEQGFVDARGEFVTRGDAFWIQHAAGIPSADPGGYRGELLYSEDLY